MRALGEESRQEARVYFTGGATAVLSGWRPSTIDVDILIVPESDELLRAIPRLKEGLAINVELACPADFLPELPGWETRSLFIESHGFVSFYHYDPYAQALAKTERGHAQDVGDVLHMLQAGVVDPERLLRLFEEIEPRLYRFPAVHPATLRREVERIVAAATEAGA
jgi:uncharacterized nucleotidyltransferase DUF6036